MISKFDGGGVRWLEGVNISVRWKWWPVDGLVRLFDEGTPKREEEEVGEVSFLLESSNTRSMTVSGSVRVMTLALESGLEGFANTVLEVLDFAESGVLSPS